MIYILNPGDGHDVSTHATWREAGIALEVAFAADRNFAALYRAERGGGQLLICRYDSGNWFPVDRSNLQAKVLDAARKAAGPQPFARTSLSESDSRG